MLGLSLAFVPTPTITQKFGNHLWREALKDLKRKIKLALFFPSKDSEFIRSLHVPNKEWTPPIELPRQIDNWFHLAFKTIYPIKNRLRFNLSRHQRHLLRHLTTRSDLVVVDSDKNLGPAILTSAQHSRLAFHHLQSNVDSYQNVPTTMAAEVLHRLQRTVESFQRDLVELHPEWRKNSKIIINKIVHTTFARFKIMPKLHKRDANNNWNGSIRPIVASPGSPTHGLSKWVDHLLRPYLSQYSTILKDSKSILIQLRQMQFSSEDRLFTFDAKSLYTSIPLRQALHVLRDITKADRMFPFISQGLEIVLDSNYFSFGSTIWKQTCGIAMGTPVAPTIANLYLAFYEERFLKSSDLWKSEIRLFQRYIDDLLLVWRPTTKKFRFNYFKALLRRQPGIQWESDAFGTTCVDFLDLNLEIKGEKIITKTFQKALNLYLYVPFQSAHAPHTLKGLVRGLLLKYQEQHSEKSDFRNLASKLFRRLHARGYHIPLLRRIFDQFFQDTQKEDTQLGQKCDTSPRRFFLSIPFNPNGPTAAEIYQTLALERLQRLLALRGFGRVTLCFRRAHNLRDILCRPRVDNPHRKHRPTPQTR